ncbi:hypothetical protein LMH87_009421 [Akanthomyces muscarius]|uniref:Uncharacterized protein n=1 Tax=Akanthomyces muscarius TaxID=2231603 RepID=A0A9W8QDH2_AKAMU|nr:hypothetical protein LMH87_009421 [Akanthomyces muscarius]KAJ4152903.1 hypothetical protein LMH87_009421 [Akanthomyces muscarius]
MLRPPRATYDYTSALKRRENYIASRIVIKRVSCVLHVRLLALPLWLSAHLPAAYALLRIPFASILHVLVTIPLLCATATGTISISAMYSVSTEPTERKDSQCNQCAHDHRTNHARHGRVHPAGLANLAPVRSVFTNGTHLVQECEHDTQSAHSNPPAWGKQPRLWGPRPQAQRRRRRRAP